MNNVKMNLEITGPVTEILSFLSACGKIQMLGENNFDKIIPLQVLGSKTAKLSFNAFAKAKIDNKEEIELELINSWIELNKDEFLRQINENNNQLSTHYIGE